MPYSSQTPWKKWQTPTSKGQMGSLDFHPCQTACSDPIPLQGWWQERLNGESWLSLLLDNEAPCPFSLNWCWEKHSGGSGLSPPSSYNKPSPFHQGVKKDQVEKVTIISDSTKVALLYPPRLGPCQRRLTKTKDLNKIHRLIPQMSSIQ